MNLIGARRGRVLGVMLPLSLLCPLLLGGCSTGCSGEATDGLQRVSHEFASQMAGSASWMDKNPFPDQGLCTGLIMTTATDYEAVKAGLPDVARAAGFTQGLIQYEDWHGFTVEADDRLGRTVSLFIAQWSKDETLLSADVEDPIDPANTPGRYLPDGTDPDTQSAEPNPQPT
jgi:hypothetical protein